MSNKCRRKNPSGGGCETDHLKCNITDSESLLSKVSKVIVFVYVVVNRVNKVGMVAPLLIT